MYSHGTPSRSAADQTQPIARTGGRPPGRPSRSRLPIWLMGLLAVAFASAVLLLGLVVHLIARDLTRTWASFALNPFQPNPANPTGPLQPGEAATALPPAATPIPWTGVERVTVLLMGLDYRDWVAGEGPARTDTMMLVTLDPQAKTGGMLSIPRDLWVEIPGFGHNRINTAYPSGEGNRLPGGGPALAMQTVEKVVGVPTQFYAVIDFAAFERMIDEIGGVDVLVNDQIKICPIGRSCKILLPKAHRLDGAETLAYARVRKGAGDDFGRAERQQQVALAIIDRVVGLDMVPTLVAKSPALYQELSSGIRTNLTLEQMISLGWLAVQTPKASIQRGVIAPPNMVGFHTLPDGAAVLRQVPDQIRLLRDQIFTQTGIIGP